MTEPLTIITTHSNADFDALGSMLAARRLYPGAQLVFPGGHEKSLRDFFVRAAFHDLPSLKVKDVDFSAVRRLVLVDCRQRTRIGQLADLAGKNGVEVVIYDHHPPSGEDVAGDEEHVEETGSTLALLCRELDAKGLSVEAHEATVMAMGVYEDTGGLTFSSTTESDYLAAAYLRRNGADLSLVAELMNRTLSREQVLLLGDLLRGYRVHLIHEVPVAIVEASAADQGDDLAVLVHRLIDLENLDALFALFQQGDRIFLIGRSRTDAVDAGAVARLCGGGGHPTAASASIKDVALAQAKEMLLDAVHATLTPHRTARGMMAYPVRTVQARQTVAEARELFTRYNINSLPVVDGGRLAGLLTRQIIAKAEFHGMAGDTVDGFMQSHCATVKPDAPFAEVYGLMVSGQQAALPVVEDGVPIGIVTRGDFLRYLRADQAESGEHPEPTRSASRPEMRKNVVHRLKSQLPAQALSRLRELGKVAADMGQRAYLVGGIVRDLLLEIDNLDVDVVVEGDGIAVARALAGKLDCRVTSHARFGTAVITFEDGAKFDVATARTEYYDRPAALPIVEASSLKLDLFRRDFSINTLVVSLNPDDFGQLVDFFGAYRDLKEGIVRVLHNLSFIEDPTRILRAVRFTRRFDFSLGKPTARLMRKALSLRVLERLTGTRLWNELRIILDAPEPLPALAEMKEQGILEQIHPALRLNKRETDMLNQVSDVLSWWKMAGPPQRCRTWLVNLHGLMAFQKPDETASFCQRMGMSWRLREAILNDRAEVRRILAGLSRRSKLPASLLYRTLSPLSIEALLLAMARASRPKVRRAIARYVTDLQFVKTRISGNDLKKFGVPPGPIYREVLDKVLDARLDERVHGKSEEIALAKKLLGI